MCSSSSCEQASKLTASVCVCVAKRVKRREKNGATQVRQTKEEDEKEEHSLQTAFKVMPSFVRQPPTNNASSVVRVGAPRLAEIIFIL